MSQTEIHDDKSLEEHRKVYTKNLGNCRLALKSIISANSVWYLFFLFSATAWYLGYLFKLVTPTASFSFIALVIVNIIFLFVVVSRIVSNLGVKKKFKNKKEYLKDMPSHSTPTIRELYVSLNCRKCIHYWLTFGFFCLSVIIFVYVIIFCIVNKLAKSDSLSLKLFNFGSYSTDPSTWWEDWSQQMVFSSIIFKLLLWFQYLFFNSKTNKFIRSLESVYGREKLVNECLLSFRIYKVEKVYKSTMFVIVCVVGCVFYIFFKKLLCTVFEKSFSV